MTPLEFLRSEAARRILERASQTLEIPVAVHFAGTAQEGALIVGVAGCAACQYVNEMPEGKTACRKSRGQAVALALERDKPTPFLCHMGFGCVSAPLFPEDGRAFMVTFGPYCPSEAPQTLVDDAQAGLAALGKTPTPMFPVALTDIPHAGSRAVPALAEWAIESLQDAWTAAQAAEIEVPAPDAMAAPSRHTRSRRGKAVDTSPYRGTEIAAALGAGDQALVRSLVRAAIAEVVPKPNGSFSGRRARTIALVGAALEAAERASLQTAEGWDQFPAFLQAVNESKTDSELASATTAFLGGILRRTRQDAPEGMLEELNRIVAARLPGPVTLNEVAKRLGKNPTAITHHLQRKYGLSYTQYVGRLRIERAKDLLRRTRLGIGAVAKRVGIADASNFSKLFRKFEGESPQQYREQYKRLP